MARYTVKIRIKPTRENRGSAYGESSLGDRSAVAAQTASQGEPGNPYSISRGCGLVVFALALMVPAPSIAAPPVRTMFAGATAKEQAVRAALADPAVSVAVLKSVRQAVASYESVVRRYPTSGYSDDALWQAARLALDAFEKFGDALDRETGLRLLRWLAAEYPASKLAKRVPDLLATEGAQKDAGRASSLRTVSNAPKAKPDAPPVSTSRVASLTNIQRSLLPDVIRVTIALDTEVSFHDERIDGPSRIFIDFPATRPAASLLDQTLRFDKDGDWVRQVRIGRQPNATTRVVLDAAGISSYSIYPVYNPYRLVIDCVRTPPVAAPREDAAVARVAPAAASVGQPKPDLTIDSAKTKPVATAALVRPRLPIAGRRLVAVSSVTLPRVIPNATDILRAARVPPILTSHRVVNDWGRTLPNASPMATAAILDAVRVPALLASRTVGGAWTRGLPNGSPAASAAVFDAAREPATLASRSLTAALIRGLPHASPARTAAIVDALAPPAPPESVPVVAAISPTTPPLPAEATPGHGSGFSMARQLGLSVSRIVIDPGHGGHDPGAKGKGGITEAELVLDVSLRLEKLLAAVPGVEVLLTRHADEFVALAERTAMANREGADLFLSIHANANVNEQVNGVETYFLNFANNLSAAAVAARENATSGQAMGALPDFVRAIALNNKLDESRDFAMLVQQSMVERLRATNKSIKSLGVKQAPFVVLIGAAMPSVLTEVSFLTHEQEAKLLKSSAYRQRIAEALFDAVRQYQGSLQRVQTVAHQ